MATKQQIAAQRARLREVIADAPEGLLIEDVAALSDLGLDHRTLQRRLASLVANRSIVQSGKGRATRYKPTGSATPPALQLTPLQTDMFVPIGNAGAEILRLVTRPIPARRPAGYNRDFLDSYRPNRSAYLSIADKARLQELGKTSGAEPAAGSFARHILNRLLIDLSWNSSRLEGNTYSLLDTQRLIAWGEAAEGKPARDAQMILNHKAAIEFLVESAAEIGFNRRTILNLHALLADDLLGDPTAPGRLRKEPVGIARSVYHPLQLPQLIEECFDQLLATAAAIRDPFEQAFFVMVQLPYLQPFLDVNKRVSRLAANIPLISSNLAPLSFVGVPEATYTHAMLGVYELNRVDLLKDVFLWAYDRSSARYAAVRQSLGAPDPFRLRHRAALKQTITEVIREAMDQKAAGAHIAAYAAAHIEEAERARFVEAAETDLLGLHEGNFARYRVRESEFSAWRAVWERAALHGRATRRPK